MVNESYKFDASVSTQSFKDKNDIHWNKVSYTRGDNITFSLFELLVRGGYCFNHLFQDKKGNQTNFTQHTWKETFFVCVDIDDCRMNMDQFISNLTFPPTLFYTTRNHTDKCPRFRILYFFSEKITNLQLYQYLYDRIIKQMEIDNNWKSTDNCGRKGTQQMSGNANYNIYYHNNYFIYDLNEFDNVLMDSPITTNSESIIKRIREEEEHYSLNDTFQNEEIFQHKEYLDNFFNWNEKDVLEAYREEYPIIFNTPLEEVSDDDPYILLPKNYIEIKYPFSTTKGKKHLYQLKDGQQRKRRLFINCILRRLIKRDIKPEHLLNNALWEYKYTIDNSEDSITKKELLNIVINALKANLNEYENLNNYKKKFRVNKNYCKKYNLSTSQVRNISRKLIKINEIFSLYDFNLTDKENIKIFKENGIKCSLPTLKRYREELDIKKYNK